MFNTAFSFTKSKFKSWPVVLTDDMDDLTQADPYKDQSPYVWLINKNYQIVESFNYNFFPSDEDRLKTHVFPRCGKQTKRPLNFQAAKLVPTTDTEARKIQVKQPNIASYGQPGFVIIHAFNDPIAVKKLKTFDNHEIVYQLVKRHSNFEDFIANINTDYVGDFVWIVDVDFKPNKNFHFDFVPKTNDTVYFYKVHHDSNKLIYADRSVMLVPVSYIIDYQKGNTSKYKFRTQEEPVGILSDASNPLKTWARSYSLTMQLINNDLGNVNKKDKNRILETMLDSDNEYVKDACNAATNDMDETTSKEEQKEHFKNSQDFKWLEEKFIAKQKKDLTSIVADKSKKIAERIARAYGKNSKEYKEALEKANSQLKSI